MYSRKMEHRWESMHLMRSGKMEFCHWSKHLLYLMPSRKMEFYHWSNQLHFMHSRKMEFCRWGQHMYSV